MPTGKAGTLPGDPIIAEADPTVEFPHSHAPAKHGPMHSLVADGRVYIRNAGGREELYDLEADTAERHDLSGSAEARAVLERFRALSRQVRRDTPRPH